MCVLDTAMCNIMVNLLDFRSDKYSTTGNDGIIEYIFKTLEIEKGFFVEFGAWDGIVGSNCRKLFEEGWTGVFIEADSKRFLDLRKNYQGEMGITCLNSKIDFDNNRFDDVIAYWTDIDFCSIDIDGDLSEILTESSVYRGRADVASQPWSHSSQKGKEQYTAKLECYG
jgi:hypothetical protein